MSGQVIELIIFAAIAFFVINKLIAMLGSTSDNDPSKRKSFFGETGKIKDVTGTASVKKSKILKPNFSKKRTLDLKGLVVPGADDEVRHGLLDVIVKIPSFNIVNFVKTAKIAFAMIIEAGANQNDEDLEELVDKRFLDNFKSMAPSYGDLSGKKLKLEAQVSEIYTFGNNVFVKILFVGDNITKKVKDLHEEWTFTKSALNEGPEWHLTNIDRPQ